MKDDLWVTGLELGTPFQAAAAMILEAKAKAMFGLEKAVRSGKDVEALHDMRVASRRVREAMEIFRTCYRAKAFKEHYRGVRRVTRTLGAVRNLDVCVDFFSELRKRSNGTGERDAVVYLLNQKKAERKRAHRKMVRKLDRLDLKRMKKSLRAFCSDPTRDGDAEEANQDMVTRARAIVEERLDHVLGYRGAIEHESDVDALHRMRIATKKLRYAMETLYIVFDDDGFDEVYNGVKGLQEMLGNIHDLDVFMGMVAEVKEEVEDRKRTRALVPGMVGMEERIRGQRHELYEQFMTFIREQDEDLRDRVLSALKSSSNVKRET